MRPRYHSIYIVKKPRTAHRLNFCYRRLYRAVLLANLLYTALQLRFCFVCYYYCTRGVALCTRSFRRFCASSALSFSLSLALEILWLIQADECRLFGLYKLSFSCFQSLITSSCCATYARVSSLSSCAHCSRVVILWRADVDVDFFIETKDRHAVLHVFYTCSTLLSSFNIILHTVFNAG